MLSVLFTGGLGDADDCARETASKGQDLASMDDFVCGIASLLSLEWPPRGGPFVDITVEGAFGLRGAASCQGEAGMFWQTRRLLV